MKHLLLIVTLFLSFNCFSQYSYYPKNEIKFLKKLVDDKIDAKIDILSKNYKKEKKEILKSRHEYLELKINDSTFIKQDKLQGIVTNVLKNIGDKNPDLNINNKTILLNSDYYPNAGSFGFNLFQINIGLFALLESEDELAFIICHELAHEVLNHFEKGVERSANLFNLNKNIIKSKKKLAQSNRTEKMKILKNMIFQNQHLSKKHEIEADSLGMVFFKNTIYKRSAAVSALQKLELTNNQFFDTKINWEKEFGISYGSLLNTTTLFNNRIIDKDFIIDSDSVKSHPDIPIRIAKITSEKINLSKKNFKYDEIQLLAIHTYLDYAKKHHIIPIALYINLQLKKQYPEKDIYNQNLINLMDATYKLKKSHRLGKHVQMTDYYSKDKNLNEIFNFLHELELYQIKKIKSHLSINQQ